MQHPILRLAEPRLCLFAAPALGLAAQHGDSVAAAIGGGDYQAAHVAVGGGHFGRLVGCLVFGFGLGGLVWDSCQLGFVMWEVCGGEGGNERSREK
jgi:hypothetical protein